MARRTGIKKDTLRRWVRDGHLKHFDLAPGWKLFHIDDVVRVQQEMRERKGGRPAKGLGDYAETAELDADVDKMMAHVMLALAVRGASPEASMRAVKRWVKKPSIPST